MTTKTHDCGCLSTPMMSEPKYKRLSSEIEDMYWTHTAGEVQDELDIGGSTYSNAVDYLGLPSKTMENKLEYQYGVPIDWLLDTLHNTLGKSVNQMSTDLDVSRSAINRMMSDLVIPRRDQSEAESLKWSQMSEEERENQVKDAHEAVRVNYAQFRTSYRGYEQWRSYNGDGEDTVKIHRLMATLLVDSIQDLDGMDVHHKNDVSWDNRLENLEVMTPDEHHKHHYGELQIDSETGRFSGSSGSDSDIEVDDLVGKSASETTW